MLHPLNKLYNRIKNREFAGYFDSRLGLFHKSVCYAPSTNMLFSQDGSVYACCHNNEMALGKYPQQSLLEIWNSHNAKQFRKDMEQNDLSKGCGICLSDIQSGDFEEVRARHFDTLNRNSTYPVMMEFLLSNRCNLECVMCKGEYSSSIRENREKLPPIVSPYNDDFVKQLEPFLPHLQETRFSGSGEAFSIEINYKIWERLIEINPKCVIMVQTNGTILTERVKAILKRGNFQIGVSLDGTSKEVFEKVRLNANFDKVLQNIAYFSDYCSNKKIKFNLSFCVMRQNWHQIPDFIQLCNKLNAVAMLHKVWFPVEYSLSTLPYNILQEVYKSLSSVQLPLDSSLEKKNRAHFNYFLSFIKGLMLQAEVVFKNLTHISNLPLKDQEFILIKKVTQTELQPENEIKNKLYEFFTLLEKHEKTELLPYICIQDAQALYHSFSNNTALHLFELAVNHFQKVNSPNISQN